MGGIAIDLLGNIVFRDVTYPDGSKHLKHRNPGPSPDLSPIRSCVAWKTDVYPP
jgi:hypothetical protein